MFFCFRFAFCRLVFFIILVFSPLLVHGGLKRSAKAAMKEFKLVINKHTKEEYITCMPELQLTINGKVIIQIYNFLR